MSTTPFNPVVLHQIVLPNGSSYTFTYNIYGEIDKIVYPTGGYEKFTLEQTAELSAHFMTDQISNFFAGGNRGVIQQRISPDGTQASEVLWQYTPGPVNWTTAPDGTRTERSVHQSQGQAIAHGFDDPRAGLAYDERVLAPNNGPMLRRKLTEWLVDGTVDYYGWRLRYKTRNPRPVKEVEIILDTGGNALAATTTYQYDADLNLISTQRYAFVEVDQSTAQTGAISAIPTGSLLRTEETDYLTSNQAYRDRNMLALPTATRIKNPAGTIISQSQILYDEGAYPLLTCGASTGWADPGTSARGNATTSKAWLNTTGGWIETHAQFDHCGSQRKLWDGKGNVSEIQYSSSYQFAYPTTSISAVPDPTGQTGSNTPLTTSTAYDFYTGLVVSATDQNNQTTSFAYGDALNRLTTVTRPTGGGSTNYAYGDTPGNIYFRVQASLDASRVVESYKYFDGLGRPHRTFLNEGGGNYLVTDTQYDNLGRVWRVSNPYRTTTLNGAINPSGVWTTTAYDSLGRVLTVTTPDNAVVTTSYSGNAVTVTDQVGKKRKSVTDALGRMTEVYEDPTGVNYLTSYSYDVLDNLTTVSQGSQTRTFVYDSLKRLTSATNPENGTISYQYDNNGNLTLKTDARVPPVTATYAYDALNRNISVDYSDSTPDSFRQYDFAINGKGRLNKVWQSGSTTSATYIDEYDALGRPLIQRQRFETGGVWSGDYSVQRTYDLAGHVKTQTYPSGRTVTYNYDQAGRLGDKDTENLAFTGNLGDGVTRTYARGIAYSVFGGSETEQFGTDTAVYNKTFYNSRGQLSEIRVSTTNATDTSWNRGAIINQYSFQCWGAACNGTDNNGNLKKQEIYVPHNDQVSSYTSWYQQYDYDNLDRLLRVHEYTSNPALDWQQEYVLDRWGNRLVHQTNTWGAGIPKPNYTVNTANNNRLVAPAGYNYGYDDPGNLTNDTYTGQGQRTYDAENRMTQAWANGQWQAYTYDADGRRVRRKVNGKDTWQIYGMDGELVAEYDANAATGSAPLKEYGYRNGQLLITAEQVNLALNKPATQSSTHHPTTSASKAVDGNTNGALWDGFASATNYNTNAWWEVDLGSVQSIGAIQVWGRSDCCTEMTSNYYVFVSDNAFTSTDLNTTLNQPGVSNYYVPGYSGTPGTTNANRTGRYVRVQFAASQYLVLGEVKVLRNTADVNWLVTDHLGTPRMIFDITGNLSGVKRADYLPFGEELYEGTGVRTLSLGYHINNVRQKFTLKERDFETGLDYFLARYYSSTQGRFTSPDEFQGGPRQLFVLGSGHPNKQALPYADITDPQTLNKYSYCRNNPLRYVDPDGHAIETAIDVVSFAISFYQLISNPSWANLGYVAWDLGATLVPFAPGSWIAKVGKYGYSGLKAAGIVGKLDDFETVVNNKFVREGVGLLGQGDESVRKVLNMGDVKAADFLGVKKGGEYVIAEAKGSNLADAVKQLNNTADALVAKVGDVKFSAEVVLRQGQKLQGDFRVVGNQLEKLNVHTQAWELQKARGKAITVRYEQAQ